MLAENVSTKDEVDKFVCQWGLKLGIFKDDDYLKILQLSENEHLRLCPYIVAVLCT